MQATLPWHDRSLLVITITILLASLLIYVFFSRNYSNISFQDLFRHVVSNRKPRSSTKCIDPRNVTFRLQGIPEDHDRKTVKILIEKLLKISDEVEVDVKSLASSPYSHFSDLKVATLNFSSIPTELSGGRGKSEWHFQLPPNLQREGPPYNVTFDTHFRGFTPLHIDMDKDCDTDLIAVSGLGGHAFGSFKERKSPHMWLRDDLPADLRRTRILIYGYESSLAGSSSFQNTIDLGKKLRRVIEDVYEGSKTSRSLILIGHSLGGIIIKQAMIEMANEKAPVLDSIRALLLFGVPSQGMSIESLVAMVGDQPNRFLLESLGKHSAVLQEQNRNFEQNFNHRGVEMVSFYETQLSPSAQKNDQGRWEMNGPMVRLVDHSSATNHQPWKGNQQHIIPMQRNHSDLVKFSIRDDDYVMILHQLLMVKDRTSRVRKPFDATSILSENQKACLQSLTSIEEDFGRSTSPPSDGTCHWLLEHDSYKSWLGQRHGLLWIKGKPGAGKSTLMRFAVQQEQMHGREMGAVIASFFFNGRGSDINKSQTGLIRSILHQILSRFPDHLNSLTSTYEDRSKLKGPIANAWKWDIDELKGILVDVFRVTPSDLPVILYVDALDESGEKNAVEVVEYFARLISVARKNPRTQLRICFSCRHYPIIELENSREICAEDENQRDIHIYVTMKLDNRFQSKEREILVESVVEKANGVFQWAVLVVPRLLQMQRKGYNFRTIQEGLQGIPDDLNHLYRDLLQSIEDLERPRALKLFRWMCFAVRPLTLMELRHAMAIEPNIDYQTASMYQETDEFAESVEKMERRITDISKGLAEVKGIHGWYSSKTVQYIHQSVGDYLLDHGLQVLQPRSQHTVAAEGHFHLSRSCIRYLSMEDRHIWTCKDSESIWTIYPFLDYAAIAWTTHATYAEQNGLPQTDLVELMDGRVCGVLDSWIHVYREAYRYELAVPVEGMTLLHVASQHGLIGTVEIILRDPKNDVNSRDMRGRTAFLLAAMFGQDKVVDVLLRAARVDPELADEIDRTPFSWAVANNHYKVAEQIMNSNRINPNAKDSHQETPLLLAARNAGDAMTRLLISRQAIEITNAEDIFMAAISNKKYGPGVLSVFLSQLQVRVPITGQLVKTTSWNLQTGTDIMLLLLEEWGRQETITEEVIEEIARRFDGRVMSLLFKQQRSMIKITLPIVVAAASNKNGGAEVIRFLLEQGGEDIMITEEVLKAAAANEDPRAGVMKVLLERRRQDVMVTKEVIKAMLENRSSGLKIMTVVLEQGSVDAVFTKEMVETASRYPEHGAKLMTALLEQTGANLMITEDGLKAAVSHFKSGMLLEALVKQRRVDVVITEKVLITAAANRGCGAEMIMLLLEQKDEEIVITEQVVEAAVYNPDSGALRVLLERRGKDIVITDEILETAVSNYGQGRTLLMLLLAHCQVGFQVSQAVLKEAVMNLRWGEELASIILALYGTNLQINEDVYVAAAANRWSGPAVIRALLAADEGKGTITERVIIAAASNKLCGKAVTLTFLAMTPAKVLITEKIVRAAGSNHKTGKKVMMALIAHRGSEVELSEATVNAIDELFDKEVMLLLLSRRGYDVARFYAPRTESHEVGHVSEESEESEELEESDEFEDL